MVNQRIYSVTQLNTEIKNLLESNPSFYNLFVQGEISNYKAHSSGHHYMTIKDDGGAISAVLFKQDALKLRFKLANGMKIIARGRVSSFPKTGQVQLYIADMMPQGIGTLHLQFEQLKQKLYNEGLFNNEHKKLLPAYPEKIALITSPTGAAIRDMLRIIKRRWSFADILIYPAAVQGTNAPNELIKALKLANKHNKADVIIIGRGGGSIEDLWAFNDENLAYEIFRSDIPVISAVGHEPDFTISDFVADMRAPTPSGAAELATPDSTKLIYNIQNMQNRLVKAQNKQIELYNTKLNSLLHRLSSPEKILKQKNQMVNLYKQRLIRAMESKQTENKLKCDFAVKQLEQAINKRLDISKREFTKNCAFLDALSPLKVLSRGYSVAVNEQGKAIYNSSQIKQGDILKIKFKKGSAECKTLKIEE